MIFSTLIVFMGIMGFYGYSYLLKELEIERVKSEEVFEARRIVSNISPLIVENKILEMNDLLFFEKNKVSNKYEYLAIFDSKNTLLADISSEGKSTFSTKANLLFQTETDFYLEQIFSEGVKIYVVSVPIYQGKVNLGTIQLGLKNQYVHERFFPKNVFFIHPLIFTGIIVFLGFCICPVLFYRFRKDVNLLKKVSENIKKDNFNIEVDIKSKDEMGEVAACFKDLTFRLKRMRVAQDTLAFRIEERNNIEAQLRKNREEIDSILQCVGDAVRVMDRDYNVTRVNSKMEELTGISQEDMLGKKCYDIFPGENCHTPSCHLGSIFKGEKNVRMEEVRKTKKGPLHVEIVLNPLTRDGEVIGIVESSRDINIRKEEQIKLEQAFREAKEALLISESLREDVLIEQKKAEDAQRNLERANEELAENERSLKNILYDMKATNEKLKATQAQLVQSEKLASLGQLSAGIAHEINNPLGFISSNLDILKEYVGGYSNVLKSMEQLKKDVESQNSDKTLRSLKELQQTEKSVNLEYIVQDIDALISQSKRGTERIKKIVQDLKTFSRKNEEYMELSDIEEIMEEVINIVWNELKYKVDLKRNYGTLPPINCNPQKLGQVFINLLVNAAHAIEEKGEIKIRTYIKDQNAFIEISDTGKGISEGYIDKIFDPFFTTKEVGKGTGLGLSIGYDIIKQHQGELFVDSVVGKGTTFIIKLPS